MEFMTFQLQKYCFVFRVTNNVMFLSPSETSLNEGIQESRYTTTPIGGNIKAPDLSSPDATKKGVFPPPCSLPMSITGIDQGKLTISFFRIPSLPFP